jgi:hypothetical protein
MKHLNSPCPCGSGKESRDCCYKTNSVVDLTQYKFDQAEKDLRLKLVDYSHRPEIQSQIGEAFYIWRNDPELLSEDIVEEDIDDLSFAKFFDWFIYDFKLLDSGERVIERFYKEQSGVLSETEKTILDDWMDNLYSFFEVEEVFPKEGCRIRDIFTGETFQVKDSSSSEHISPSDIIAGRPLKTGRNVYFSGVVSVYPQAFKSLIIDFFNREFKEYKKTFGRKQTPKAYLKDWGFLIGLYIEDIIKNPSFITPEGDELLFASAIYSVKSYDKVLKKLREMKPLEEVEGGTDELRLFSWIRRGKNKLLGTIEVEKDKLTIECYSINLLTKAKKLIEKKLGGLITHNEDSVKKLESFMETPTHETTKIKKLPSGVKSKGELDTILDEYYDEWVDRPLEILEGKTPRELSRTKKIREKLDSILRELESIYKHARQRGEPYYDVGKLRKKLRLE